MRTSHVLPLLDFCGTEAMMPDDRQPIHEFKRNAEGTLRIFLFPFKVSRAALAPTSTSSTTTPKASWHRPRRASWLHRICGTSSVPASSPQVPRSCSQCLPHGVCIAMDGCFFTWDNVAKNRSIGAFEPLH
jgi:hypothetical protein